MLSLIGNMKINPCKLCGSQWHTAFKCRLKVRAKMHMNVPLKRSSKVLRPESKKSMAKRKSTYKKWVKANPPNEYDTWTCYLQISSLCPKILRKEYLTLEHIIPKVKAPELKYDISNIKPACSFCNKQKGSQTLDKLARIFPHLKQYIPAIIEDGN